MMARTADITIERNYKGMPTCIKFNYRKYGALLNSFCTAHGIDFPVENVPNETTAGALEEAHQGKGTVFPSADDFIADLYK
jgi:hypothetical protein